MKREKKKGFFEDKKGQILQTIFLLFFFLFLELFFHISEGMDITGRLWYPVLFCVPMGVFLASLYGLLPTALNRVLSILTMLLGTVWIIVQICYASVFQTYMDFNKIFMGGDVAANFGGEAWDAVCGNKYKILFLMAVWLIGSVVLVYITRRQKAAPKYCLVGLLAAGVLHLGCLGVLMLGGTGAYSPWKMYTQYPRFLDNNVENFGIFPSLCLEWKDILLKPEAEETITFETEDMSALLSGEGQIDEGNETIGEPEGENDGPGTSGAQESASGNVEETTTPPETESVFVPIPQMRELDFEVLMEGETDEEILSLHRYIQTLTGSSTNTYTGMFEGYNLIMICAESFTSYMIDEELTPTLYKMSTEGFVFENFYGTFKAVTTNGEYAFCTGLMPNTSGSNTELKENSTFKLSSDRYLPYCMGNVFRSMGADTYFYHSNVHSFYDRSTTHPNMGYDICRFLDGSYVNGEFRRGEKLTFSTGNKRPNSDEETLLQTVTEYLGNRDENGKVKPFHAYYMTYSGHHPYYDMTDTEHIKSPMVYENREIVDGLSCSPNVKGYLAANLEVENMMRELLAALEEAGCLENTVIVLTSDHYPYGLSDAQFAELAAFTGKEVESPFGIYRNSFLCYNAGMEEAVIVEEPCCTVDIIPTLLNLFGVSYDSRLLCGTDVLDPDAFHVAMLYNQSFITDRIQYNTTKGQFTYLTEEDSVSQEYVDACIRYVQNKFDLSLQIINNDYYEVVRDYLQ